MKTITLGTTGITTPQNAFGALPVQRVNMETAVEILQRAYDGGISVCPHEPDDSPRTFRSMAHSSLAGRNAQN